MAIRLEETGWSDAGTWLRMQLQYDLWQAEKRVGKIKSRNSAFGAATHEHRLRTTFSPACHPDRREKSVSSPRKRGTQFVSVERFALRLTSHEHRCGRWGSRFRGMTRCGCLEFVYLSAHALCASHDKN